MLKYCAFLLFIIPILFSCDEDNPTLDCEFSVDVNSSDEQFYSDEGPVEVSYEVNDNSTSPSAFTVYCFEKQCITNNDIGEIFSQSFASNFAIDFTVTEPGIYRSVLYANDVCTDESVIIDQLDFTIWYPQQFHPCE